jgi:hypothetical protein
MPGILQILLSALLLVFSILPLSGCGCGFDCNSDNISQQPALLTLGLSDSLPEDLKQVVIEVDSITFKRSGADDVVVDTFTFGPADAATFEINLLKYSGLNQLVVIEDLELDVGTYEVVIAIIATGTNSSYVQEAANDSLQPITVSGGKLTLPGLKLSSGKQAFTVEFGLAQALQFKSTTDGYLLTTTGIRIENNLTGASLSGTVESALFDTVSPCDEKNPPTAGNRVYLYQGIDLATGSLADVFTTGNTTTPPTNALAPFAVASLLQKSDTENWEYAFGYLPAGNYTLAFACDTAADDAVQYNGLLIPQPTNQLYNITLSEAKKSVCNLTAGGSC